MLSPRVLFMVLMSCLVLFSYDGAEIVMILWISTGGLIRIATKEVRRILRQRSLRSCVPPPKLRDLTC